MTSPLSSDGRRAFLSAPEPKRYFAAGSIEEARQRLVRSIARSEGPALVIGAPGAGKSLLLAVLADQFQRQRATATLVGGQLCTRRALLQSILAELGLSYRGLDEAELRLTLTRHVRGDGGPPRRLLLLVDDADALPLRLVEELRMLSNLATAGLPLVEIVLAGGPALEELFADPRLESFSQRIAARTYLAPLGREETFQYVRAQATAAGIKPERLFDDGALGAIYAATGGVPRLINQLGDQLTWLAEETGVAPLDAALVQQAWSDLQQLPAPWNTDVHLSVPAASVGVVEFGELDADDAAHIVSSPAPTARWGALAKGDKAETGIAASPDFDDDLPASIPIAAARSRREPSETELAARFAEAEELIGQLGRIGSTDLATDAGEEGAGFWRAQADGSASPTAASLRETVVWEVGAQLSSDPSPSGTGHGEGASSGNTTSLAADPFAGAFEVEEVVTDRYAAFEAALLRSAAPTASRTERAFAEKLPLESFAPAPAKPMTKPAPTQTPAPQPSAPEPIVPLTPAPPAGDVLVIEDDEAQSSPKVVQARHFRRLFSTLESNSARSLSG